MVFPKPIEFWEMLSVSVVCGGYAGNFVVKVLENKKSSEITYARPE
jgi:hypothetical protein